MIGGQYVVYALRGAVLEFGHARQLSTEPRASPRPGGGVERNEAGARIRSKEA
jgi:hypothetical protein